MTDPQTDSPKPRRPWGRIALVLSLGANLLIVGLVAGAMIKGPPDRSEGRDLRDLGFGPFFAALPRDERGALSAALEREAPSFRERRHEMRQQFDALLAALRAEPYDHAAVAGIVDAQQAAVVESQRMGRALLLDQIAGMEPAQRQAYADALARGLRRWKPGRDRHD